MVDLLLQQTLVYQFVEIVKDLVHLSNVIMETLQVVKAAITFAKLKQVIIKFLINFILRKDGLAMVYLLLQQTLVYLFVEIIEDSVHLNSAMMGILIMGTAVILFVRQK